MLDQQLIKVKADGHIVAESRDILGLTDLCCPILDAESHALACVTLVAVTRRSAPPDFSAMMQQISMACAKIRDEMGLAPLLEGGSN